MKSFVLFNNKGGVGKTMLTVHLAHMLARMSKRVVALDYDPQSNLTSMLIEEDELFEKYSSLDDATNVAACLEPVRRGRGEVREPSLVPVADDLWLLPGHLGLSRFEQSVAEEWPKKASPSNERALDVTLALDILSNRAAEKVAADYVVVDVGPSLGALNRSALLACDAVIFPVAPDLFSLQGLENVGPSLRDWRDDWKLVRERYLAGPAYETISPHDFQPLGYVVQQQQARVDRPTAKYAHWARQIPATYRRYVLDKADVLGQEDVREVEPADDQNCIGMIKHFASLVPIAQQARKPVFDLKQADGIGGGQIQAVFQSRALFEAMSREIMRRLG